MISTPWATIIMWQPSAAASPRGVRWSARSTISPLGRPNAGGHVRAIREGERTYAVYFGMDGAGLEYEPYNIKSDPS